MKGVISISEKNQITWVPKILTGAGFKGKVSFLTNCYTVVLLHPDATLQDIEKSLQITLEDVRLRQRKEEEASHA